MPGSNGKLEAPAEVIMPAAAVSIAFADHRLNRRFLQAQRHQNWKNFFRYFPSYIAKNVIASS